MRVIQDSDEEFEEELESDIQPSKAGNAAAVQHDRIKDAPSTPGTGSTESLKRAFTEAHCNHLQSPSALLGLPYRHEPQSSVSLPDHGSKRRKTFADIDSHRITLPKSPKPCLATYENNYKSLVSNPSTILVNDFSSTDSHGNEAALVGGVTSVPDGVRRDEFAQHEPMALFPAPSSTVPNATLTQQRLLQGLAATEFMGIDFDAEPPPHCLIREPSVPWSDIMKFSPVENVDPSGPCDTQIEVKTETLPRVSEQLRESFNPQQGSIEFGVQLTGSPLRVETFSSDNVGQKKGVLSSQATFSDKDLRQPSTPRSSRRGASGEGQQISQHQKSEAHLILDPEDPEVTSLPKEQYKPRPSRSRSLKMDTSEPVDYSVRPEKAVKRRKTTTTTSLGRSTREKAGIKTPQKVQMICEMGFTPISTGTALKQHSGDVAQSIDWLINNGMGKDELALPNTPKRKPTSKEPKSVNKVAVETPGKVSTNKEGGRISTAAEINVSKNRSVANEPLTRMTDLDSTSSLPDIPMPPTTVARSPHVQVVIPLKSPKSPLPQKLNSTTVSTAKTKRRKTPLEVSDSNSVLGTPIVPEVVIGKKKERGRPKKANNSVLPPNDGQFVSQETVEHQQESSEIVGDTESDPMVIPATHSDNAKPTATAKDTQIDPTISVSTSGQKNTPPPIIPHIPDKSTKSSSRSPTGKNRVTYRVGLSKRARIAPLLRTLKK